MLVADRTMCFSGYVKMVFVTISTKPLMAYWTFICYGRRIICLIFAITSLAYWATVFSIYAFHELFYNRQIMFNVSNFNHLPSGILKIDCFYNSIRCSSILSKPRSQSSHHCLSFADRACRLFLIPRTRFSDSLRVLSTFEVVDGYTSP
jgi:hypothetical protein